MKEFYSMRKSKLLTLIGSICLVLVLAALSFMAACAKPAPTPTPTPTPTPEIPKEILLGDVVSYTGAFAAWGQQVAFGEKAALEDINNMGGVYVEEYGTRIPIRWVTLDSESDMLKVATLAEDLILRENVDFLGAHMEYPPMRQGIAMMAEKYKVAAVIGAGLYEAFQSMEEAAGGWDYTYAFGFHSAAPFPEGDFRHGDPAYSMMDTFLGALDKFGPMTNKKVALLAIDDPDGRVWYQTFTRIMTEKGYDCHRSEEQFGIYPVGSTDFSSIINEFKDAGCELLWGSSVGEDYGTFWRQCHVLGFQPKIFIASRGATLFSDIEPWGGDLPNGVIIQFYWSPEIKNATGIGDTTPQSLVERWYEATGGKPLNIGIAWDYLGVQILVDAIERAGTLDTDAVLEALRVTDMNSIFGRVKFVDGWHAHAVAMGQWQKTDNPWVWESRAVFSYNEDLPATAEMIFPIPYD
jgi:branched-chain amino acid transport system substrate-binding protein